MEIVQVLKDLEALKELQRIDLELDDLQKNKEHFPHKIDSLKSRLKSEEAELEASKKALSDLEEKKRGADLELKEKEEKIAKSQDRLMAVKSNDEFRAMQREIDLAKKENGLVEEQILEIMLQIDEAKKAVSANEGRLAEKKKEIESDLQIANDEFKKVDVHIKEQQTFRETKVKEVNEEVLTNYIRIRTKISTAVTETSAGKCLGCDISLPPQLYNQIQSGKDIFNCPNCHRILITSSKA